MATYPVATRRRRLVPSVITVSCRQDSYRRDDGALGLSRAVKARLGGDAMPIGQVCSHETSGAPVA